MRIELYSVSGEDTGQPCQIFYSRDEQIMVVYSCVTGSLSVLPKERHLEIFSRFVAQRIEVDYLTGVAIFQQFEKAHEKAKKAAEDVLKQVTVSAD